MSWARKQQLQREAEQADRDRRNLVFLSGGLAAGGAIFAWGRGLLPPWLLAILWFSALALVWRGLPWLGTGRLATHILRGVATIVALTLWLSSSPRAEIRIVAVEDVPEHEAVQQPWRVGQPAVNVFYKNVGHWRASVRRTSLTRVLPQSVFAETERRRQQEVAGYQVLGEPGVPQVVPPK